MRLSTRIYVSHTTAGYSTYKNFSMHMCNSNRRQNQYKIDSNAQLNLVHIIFLKYMLGKISIYPGNKASGKVSLVSPLVIIKVYINSLSIL